jgi:NADH-quinone oxidoreductase subunit B
MKEMDTARHPFADIQLARRADLLAWSRSRSLWPFNFGLSCCYVELATALTSKFDLARFGSEIIRGSPREADVMVVAGTVFKKMAPIVRHMWEQMMEPRWVIAMGSCASSGGMYDIYSVVQGVDSFLPVDIYIQGCPPSPDSFMRGLTLLQESVEQERRPLSWVVGPQGVVKPPRPSMRDIMRDERRDRGGLEAPDRI